MSNIKATEISVNYNLPDNWSNESAYSFDHLSDLVLQLHNSAYTAAVKAVNRFATVHNDVIGFYIVEYEQNGSDRAKYGEQLLKRLAKKVNKRGINETLLKNARNFYLLYPHIKNYLCGEICATPSDKFVTPAEKLIMNLSFSHIVYNAKRPLAYSAKTK